MEDDTLFSDLVEGQSSSPPTQSQQQQQPEEDRDPHVGLFIILPIYFTTLLGCAIWANYKNRQEIHRGRPHRSRGTSSSTPGMTSSATATNHPNPANITSSPYLSSLASLQELRSMRRSGGGLASTSASTTHGGRGGENTNTNGTAEGLTSTASFLSTSNHHHQQQHSSNHGNTGLNSTDRDILVTHFLGGRNLGPILSTGTILASYFSGYTVVGIPNEAYENGFLAFRWLAGSLFFMFMYFGCALRLRKAALVRNHKTSVDFITDRFQSQVLRYAVLLLQVVPSLFYIMAQVVTLKSTFNSMFHLSEDTIYPVVIIMATTLMFEWIGGLRCVAMTDCVQGSLIILGYLCLLPEITKLFGGWNDIDLSKYPKPEFYQTPKRQSQFEFWQFSFMFFTYPHMMQRTYAARDLGSLKVAFGAMGIGCWFLMFTGVFVGTMAVQILHDAYPQEQQQQPFEKPGNPFIEVLALIIDRGGFATFAGLVILTGTLAAITSTADSLLVSLSQLITEEIVYPISPNASPQSMVWVARASSFCAVALATLMGISWDKGMSTLANINFQLMSQPLIIFVVGLFARDRLDCHPWILAFGAFVALLYILIIYFSYIYKHNEGDLAINAGVTGLALQLIVIALGEFVRRIFFPRQHYVPNNRRNNNHRIRGDASRRALPQIPLQQEQRRLQISQPISRQNQLQGSRTLGRQLSTNSGSLNQDIFQDLIFPNRPAWDIPPRSRFGEKPLTPSLLWKMMEGVDEPLANPWHGALMFLSISWITPWIMEGFPANISDMPNTVVAGLPWWVFKMVITMTIPTFFIGCTVYRIPRRFPRITRPRRRQYSHSPLGGTESGGALNAETVPTPVNDAEIEQDPDVMELTPEELGHRTAYDERNGLVYKRRRQILEKLGISPNEIDSIVASTQHRLQQQDFQPQLNNF